MTLNCLASEDVFSFHLSKEPLSLNPSKLSETSASYFYSSIFEPLLRIDSKNNLQAAGAKSCYFKTQKKVICDLDPQKKWSDGTEITAQDYLNGFYHILGPDTFSKSSYELFSILNAQNYLNKISPAKNIGVRAISKFQLKFNLNRRDPDFLFKLAQPNLIPIKILPQKENLKSNLYNGPYVIEKWISKEKIFLTPNPYYPNSKHLPKVEILFIQNDNTAYNLYSSKKINFLRRLPSQHLAKYRNSKELLEVDMLRFDYIGFSSKIPLNIRKTLFHSIHFDNISNLLNAKHPMGCSSLSEDLLDDESCIKFEKIKWDLQNKDKELTTKYKLQFSQLAGEDVKNSMAYFSQQWKQNLKYNIPIQQTEHMLLQSQIKNNKANIFRKGIMLKRPTCLSALEYFKSDNPLNYLNIQSNKLDQIINSFNYSTSKKESQKLCSEGLKSLMATYQYLPLGRIHFSMLMSPKFKGIEINSLNQLYIANLRYVP